MKKAKRPERVAGFAIWVGVSEDPKNTGDAFLVPFDRHWRDDMQSEVCWGQLREDVNGAISSVLMMA